MPEGEKLAAFAATGATLAIHLSIHVLEPTLAQLVPHYGADCPGAVVCRKLAEERVVRGTLGTLAGLVAQAGIDRGIDPGWARARRPGPTRKRALRRNIPAPLPRAPAMNVMQVLPATFPPFPTSSPAKCGWSAPAPAIHASLR